MKLRIQGQMLKPPVTVADVQSIVVYDAHDQPLALWMDLEDGRGFWSSDVREGPAFFNKLQELGVTLRQAPEVSIDKKIA